MSRALSSWSSSKPPCQPSYPVDSDLGPARTSTWQQNSFELSRRLPTTSSTSSMTLPAPLDPSSTTPSFQASSGKFFGSVDQGMGARSTPKALPSLLHADVAAGFPLVSHNTSCTLLTTVTIWNLQHWNQTLRMTALEASEQHPAGLTRVFSRPSLPGAQSSPLDEPTRTPPHQKRADQAASLAHSITELACSGIDLSARLAASVFLQRCVACALNFDFRVCVPGRPDCDPQRHPPWFCFSPLGVVLLSRPSSFSRYGTVSRGAPSSFWVVLLPILLFHV